MAVLGACARWLVTGVEKIKRDTRIGQVLAEIWFLATSWRYVVSGCQYVVRGAWFGAWCDTWCVVRGVAHGAWLGCVRAHLSD